MKLSKNFRLLVLITAGFLLAFFVYQMVSPVLYDQISAYRAGYISSEAWKIDLEQRLGGMEKSYKRATEKVRELRQQISDLKKSNEVLENQVVEAREPMPAQKVVQDTPPLIETVIDRLDSAALIQIDTRWSGLEACSLDGRLTLLTWLQFLMVYGEFDLKEVERDADKLQDLLLDHAEKVRVLAGREGFVFWPLVDQLVLYHDRIRANDGWQQDFDAILEKPHRLGELVSQFYQRGYRQSGHGCFTQPLAMTVTDGLGSEWRQGWSGSRITLEEWLYSFWLRRYQEQTWDIAYLGLKMLQLFSPDQPSGRLEQLTLVSDGAFSHLRRDTDEQTAAPYQDVMYGVVGREANSSIAIPVDKAIESDFVTTLYPLTEDAEASSYSYASTDQSYLKDELSPTYWLKYRRSVEREGEPRPPFVSPEPIGGEGAFYKKAELDESHRSEVVGIIEREYGTTWAGKGTVQGHLYCDNNPHSSVQKLTNGEDVIYIASASCSSWGSGGSVGPYFGAVLREQANGEIDVVWAHRGLRDMVNLGANRYVADLDQDGNIEIVVNMAGGVSSESHLVELSGRDMFLIQSLAGHSEGGYEDYPRREQNRILLSQE